MKLVTYVARGMESMRGFDIFMRAAKQLCRPPDGRASSSSPARTASATAATSEFTGGKSFKEWVLAQDDYDLSRFVFLGTAPADASWPSCSA